MFVYKETNIYNIKVSEFLSIVQNRGFIVHNARTIKPL